MEPDYKAEAVDPIDEPAKPKVENLEDKEASQYQPTSTIKLSYLVGKKTEANKNGVLYETIQEAIDAAINDSVIKISHGLYMERLVIKDKVLKLEAKDTNSEVYILGADGPALTVDNSTNGNVTVEWIKFAHKGDTKKDKKKEGETMGGASRSKTKSKKENLKESRSEVKHKTTLNHSFTVSDGGGSGGMINNMSAPTFNLEGQSNATTKSSIKERKVPKSSLVNYLQELSGKLPNIDSNTQCAILVKNGTFIMRNCKVNMNLLSPPLPTGKSPALVPAVVGLNNSFLIIKDCEFRGSNTRDSIGLYLKNCNLLMKTCTLTHFKSGGGHIVVSETNSTKIYSSKFTFNGSFGLQLIGRTVKENLKGKAKMRNPYFVKEDEEPEIIKDCEIEKNDGPGLQIICPSSIFVKKNMISYNKNGIEIISADPKIYENNISKNTGNGIMIKTVEGLYSIPIIRNNTIRSNRESGIYCTGPANLAKIIENDEICYNKLCGLKVEDRASPHIIKNKVFKNIFQGILIVDGASGHVEGNKIFENIKANIAFGGSESVNTMIVSNEISKGRCEGIFMIEAGCCYIRHNVITENYDGIIMITSCPEVTNNQINGNKNSGMMIMKDSRPKIYNNVLEANGSVGFFVRDNSQFSREENLHTQKKLDGQYDRDGNQLYEQVSEVKTVFHFVGNKVLFTPVALVVERHISEGKKIVALNELDGPQRDHSKRGDGEKDGEVGGKDIDFEEEIPPQECRIPYTLKEIKCALI